MAYRRRHGIARSSTFKEEVIQHSSSPAPDQHGDDANDNNNNSSSSSLAAQAIRASAAHRDSSSLSSAYGDSALHPSTNGTRSKDHPTYEYTSLRTSNESKGFWGILAEKAKAILEEDNVSQQFEPTSRMKSQRPDTTRGDQLYSPYQSLECSKKMDNPGFRKRLDALTSSLNHISDTIGNAFEEGRTLMEHKTADIIQETRKLQIRRKGSSSDEPNRVPADAYNPWQQPSMQSTQPELQTNRETQIKASRDVAMATAAKAKLLLRELKTVKADLAFAKERCAQLEEENRILREAREKGDNPADDDMIRLQLETLLAEKARLAHENSVYARENRFLREIVEYHQLKMQDLVYLDEGIEEVTEVYHIHAVSRMLSVSPSPSPTSPRSPPHISPSPLELETISVLNQATTDVSHMKPPPIHDTQIEISQSDDPHTENTPSPTSST